MITTHTLSMCTTDREQEVLALLSQGYTAKEIASSLYISPHTVESHRRNLIHKLKAKNSINMVAIAAKIGLI